MKRARLRAILVSSLLAGILVPSSARADAPKFLDFGVKGGLALPAFFWTGDAGWNPITLFALRGEAYAFACAKLSPLFAIQVEAGYQGKGCEVDASDGYAHWYMDYLQVPVWAKWSSRLGPDLGFYGGLGCYAAYFIGGRYDFGTGVPGLDGAGRLVAGKADSPTTVRPWDFGALLACGIEGRRLVFEVRMPIGIVESMRFTPPEEFGGARGTLNSGFDIIVGYRL